MRNWKLWAKCAGIRAIKTVAQTTVGVIGAAAAVQEVDWVFLGGAALLAGITSLLTSIVGLPEVDGVE